MEDLEFSVAKTQFMTLNNPRSDDQPISINGQVITKCEEYKYLGNILHSSGDLEHNIHQSIAAAWLKLREIMGVTCDKKMVYNLLNDCRPIPLEARIWKSSNPDLHRYFYKQWESSEKQSL
ncbi:unnamed protein product [Arctia plantaginis]|uniref:Reverse transcriptase n=1 Tax=Arctia plantaginis TaxID=874455 RepID=A0A8S0ZDX2_ARCPL|nr:unnamed protein product [Arctia plantaginis]